MSVADRCRCLRRHTWWPYAVMSFWDGKWWSGFFFSFSLHSSCFPWKSRVCKTSLVLLWVTFVSRACASRLHWSSGKIVTMYGIPHSAETTEHSRNSHTSLNQVWSCPQRKPVANSPISLVVNRLFKATEPVWHHKKALAIKNQTSLAFRTVFFFWNWSHCVIHSWP